MATTKKTPKKTPAKKKSPAKAASKKPAVKKVAVKPVVKTPAVKKPVVAAPIVDAPAPIEPTPPPAPKRTLVDTLAQQPVRWKQLYAVGAVLVLVFTTLLWALLGAQLQQSNADQFADPALFASSKVFRLAEFPGTHSFLLKWPLFFLIRLFGYSDIAYYSLTVLAALLTVGGLAYIIYRIERRPLVFSAIILSLSSVLLLVPAVPAAGTLLPVNMAMLTTRNLEYVLYILSLVFLVRAHRRKSWTFAWAVLALSLVIASDKLFLSLSLGGAVVTTLVALVARRKEYRKLAVNWLIASVLAGLLASLGLWALQKLGVTHFSNTAEGSPYAVVLGLKHAALGTYFVVFHTLTNFGANPAYDVGVVKQAPRHFIARLLKPAGVSYLVNLAVLVVSLGGTAWLTISTLRKKEFTNDQPTQLTLLLVASSLVAIAAFIATNHYFFADARYLTILLFTAFIGITTFVRQKTYNARQIVVVSSMLLIGMLLGLTAVNHAQHQGRQALQATNDRNELVAQALKNHPVDTLLGDYWRTLPISQLDHNKIPITPLSDCTTPRQILSSAAWQTNLDDHSFAYLLSFDRSLSDFPSCGIEQVIKAYGRPNASTLIAGQLGNPHELLLFYDHGRSKSEPTPQINTPASSTVLPIKLSQLPDHTCDSATIVNVVAHEDDDLLFMSPDLLHEVQGLNCVRSIYLTAGDAGGNKLYWTAREKAVEAAYSSMLKTDDIWEQRIVEINPHQFAIVANPRGNSKISLVFLRLPDGNMRGQGFHDNAFESLQALETGRISLITSVDLQSSYSRSGLIDTLGKLISVYRPDAIHTQAPNNLSHFYQDHSDHLAVGRLVGGTIQQTPALAKLPVTYYVGYPIHELPPNITGQDLTDKNEAFYTYAQFDPAVCRTQDQCSHGSALGFYLERMYTTKDFPAHQP